jgi:hypothetical protein
MPQPAKLAYRFLEWFSREAYPFLSIQVTVRKVCIEFQSINPSSIGIIHPIELAHLLYSSSIFILHAKPYQNPNLFRMILTPFPEVSPFTPETLSIFFE